MLHLLGRAGDQEGVGEMSEETTTALYAEVKETIAANQRYSYGWTPPGRMYGSAPVVHSPHLYERNADVPAWVCVLAILVVAVFVAAVTWSFTEPDKRLVAFFWMHLGRAAVPGLMLGAVVTLRLWRR